MKRIKKIGFIMLLIIFIIGFPLIGAYKSNELMDTRIYPTMEVGAIQIAWMVRGVTGAWMLLIIKHVNLK